MKFPNRPAQGLTYAQLEERGALADLAGFGAELQNMPRADLKGLLEEEWSKLSAEDKSAFGADIDNYAAYRRASAAGRVKIRMGTPAES